MYNKIILAGNLTRDIEIKYTQGGSAIGNTAIATTRKFKGQDGTQKEEVLFVDITFFGRTAEVANQYLRKGSKVLVDGRLKLDQWTAQDGTKRSKHSVTVENLTMLGGKDEATPMPTGKGEQENYSEHGYGEEDYTPALQTPTQKQAPAPKKDGNQPEPYNNNIPEIDLDAEDIPF